MALPSRFRSTWRRCRPSRTTRRGTSAAMSSVNRGSLTLIRNRRSHSCVCSASVHSTLPRTRAVLHAPGVAALRRSGRRLDHDLRNVRLAVVAIEAPQDDPVVLNRRLQRLVAAHAAAVESICRAGLPSSHSTDDFVVRGHNLLGPSAVVHRTRVASATGNIKRTCGTATDSNDRAACCSAFTWAQGVGVLRPATTTRSAMARADRSF
jgi:hypothetical protein